MSTPASTRRESYCPKDSDLPQSTLFHLIYKYKQIFVCSKSTSATEVITSFSDQPPNKKPNKLTQGLSSAKFTNHKTKKKSAVDATN